MKIDQITLIVLKISGLIFFISCLFYVFLAVTGGIELKPK